MTDLDTPRVRHAKELEIAGRITAELAEAVAKEMGLDMFNKHTPERTRAQRQAEYATVMATLTRQIASGLDGHI